MGSVSKRRWLSFALACVSRKSDKFIPNKFMIKICDQSEKPALQPFVQKAINLIIRVFEIEK